MPPFYPGLAISQTVQRGSEVMEPGVDAITQVVLFSQELLMVSKLVFDDFRWHSTLTGKRGGCAAWVVQGEQGLAVVGCQPGSVHDAQYVEPDGRRLERHDFAAALDAVMKQPQV